jgi:FtsP/CotA-like multicopper oxidase with cupredoxin domain
MGITPFVSLSHLKLCKQRCRRYPSPSLREFNEGSAKREPMNRRNFLTLSGAAALDLASGTISSLALDALGATKPDYTIRIAPVSFELAPTTVIKTVGYNGKVPGPIIRMREGKRVTIEVRNDTDVPELVHWHGQAVSADVDGAEEESTPPVPPHGRRQYSFTPQPAGTRWYHTHAMAGADINRSTYTGQYGFFIVEPKSEPGNYDQEIFLAARHWEPSIALRGRWRVDYKSASLGERALGHGDPIRVRQGQRVLFHILNADASETHRVSLPGHRFKVLALDGNPVPTPATVEMVQVGIGERVDAIVEMNNSGVWILGSTADDDRNKGLGVVVEYARQKGEPRWMPPADANWDYTVFASQTKTQIPEPDGRFEMSFTMLDPGDKPFNMWTINDKSWPDTEPLLVKQGRRYRLVYRNGKDDAHPMHLHRHNVEIVSVAGKPTAGLVKDVVQVRPNQTVEVDFLADNPGPSLLHCHNQMHMDFGFKTLVKYV